MHPAAVDHGHRPRNSNKRMTGCGRFAALLAVLLIPASLLIGTPQAHAHSLGFGPAWAASPVVAAPRIPGVAAPFALPSLALPSLSALNVAAALEALAVFAKALLFWPVAAFAGLAAWLIRLRQARWTPIAAESVEQDYPPTDAELEPAQALPLLLSRELAAPDPRPQVQGADLAARARFVAMTFAFPETGPSRQALSDWPLHMNCQPTRFTLTLQHAALNYQLEFCNRGAEALGPLIIRADLVAAESRAGQNRQTRLAADAMPVCHYLDSLLPGDSIELTGELRLPLAGVAAMRLGTAELLVPLLRLCAESAGESREALSVSARFAIGMPPLSSGGGIQPFRLDSGPGIWRKLTARRLIGSDLS